MTKFRMNKGLCALYPINNSDGNVCDYLFISAGLRRHYEQAFARPVCRCLARNLRLPKGFSTFQELNTWAHMEETAKRPWEDTYNSIWEEIPYGYISAPSGKKIALDDFCAFLSKFEK